MSFAGGYANHPHERYVEHTNKSTLHKLKQSYWTTKQAMKQKLGKKEDACIVASDAQLDAKLEVFHAIQKSCMTLLKILEKYQERLCVLSQEENSMGRFLKNHGQTDKTRAGKMMTAVGKAQCQASQQRLALRSPLLRLYQEVETFRYRAISDTLITVNKMETARTEYRAALMWMKDVSEELDPDAYSKLEKFRKVQAQVRKTKARFEKLKVDVVQKVELLTASRCNMFSHVLAGYQGSLLHFWERTARTLRAVSESFKGYQHYEFGVLKALSETSKRLAKQTGGPRDSEDEDEEGEGEAKPSREEGDSEGSGSDYEEFWSRYSGLQNRRRLSNTETTPPARDLDLTSGDGNDLEEALKEGENMHGTCADDKCQHCVRVQQKVEEARRSGWGGGKEEEGRNGDADDAAAAVGTAPEDDVELISFDDDDDDAEGKEAATDGMSADDYAKAFRTHEQAEAPAEGGSVADEGSDEAAFLADLLGGGAVSGKAEDEAWAAFFDEPAPSAAAAAPLMEAANQDKSGDAEDFLPSHLLEDLASLRLGQDLEATSPAVPTSLDTAPLMAAGVTPAPPAKQQKQPQQRPPAKGSKAQKSDMAAWFHLFADLDPLANPDAIGRKKGDDSKLNM